MRDKKGRFIKGHKPFLWNKGLKVDRGKYPKMGHFSKHTETSRKEMSKAHSGKPRPWRKGKKYPAISKALKGRKFSEAHKRKIGKSKEGQIPWNKGTKGLCKPNSSSFKSGERQKRLSALANKKQAEMKGPTSIEKKVYDELKRRGILFEKQKLINGHFLVDAYIPSLNLVIEADGDYWHSLDKIKKQDKAKNAYLKACGFNLLRFSGTEIRNDIEGCIDKTSNLDFGWKAIVL